MDKIALSVWVKLMIFSKSLSYALRGVLYIASMQDTRRYLQSDQIAEQLAVPRHFMSKILKKLAKEKIIASVKGPTGGFTVTEQTINTTIMQLLEIMEGGHVFRACVLRLAECSEEKPCPMHMHMRGMRNELEDFLNRTTIGELMLQGHKSNATQIANSSDAAQPLVFHINLSK